VGYFHLDGPKLVPNETEHEWKALITKPEKWWTRTQRIRTMAEVLLEVCLLDTDKRFPNHIAKIGSI
jgi:hypothetical protein